MVQWRVIVSVDYKVISIGALARNRLWGESADTRTSHATTTVVCVDDRVILVDPSLPGAILDARFNERTGRRLADVTDVFCTTLRQVHRRALADIPQANWWAASAELEWYRGYLTDLLDTAARAESQDAAAAEADLKLLERIQAAPNGFDPQVQLYPLAGPTPGTCGLLLTPATHTIVIASDAALTAEHVMHGRVWAGCLDADAALASLRDLLELADVIVCGHDNVLLTPRRWL